CKTFGALEASRDVSLSVRPGEIHALIGPNGAGKSTLISQICGTQPPDSGTVHLMGQDVTHLSAAARARAGLARTFQISALAPELSVLQNAVLGALGASGGSFRMAARVMGDAALLVEADEALDRVGLTAQRDTRVSDLSHAQRRLLEVAVALTLRPKVFLMDEPMAGLGADGSRALTALLADLRNEAPILLVEHDMDAVFVLADRISVLVYGRIITTGSPRDIRADAAVREAYLGEETP
ncbi:MAG: ABC transporter ATP-binding protein, partial [Alphaproteobacteria bacterium]|nr:ABC transporter ATP-binding protein [Alphaproteobacteria bacterium]